MFLMTDGQNEKEIKEFENNLSSWGRRFGERDVYGFYVMLHDAARNKGVEAIINRQPHLWKVESADVNINLVRLQSKAMFNVRNDTSFDLPLTGNVDRKTFTGSFPAGSPLQVSKVKYEAGKLCVFVKVVGNRHKIPVVSFEDLTLSMKGGGKFDFLVTNKIKVKCINKPERSLKITVR